MAVTDAEHPVQEVHGALVDQVPEVQPGQSEAGQALPPNQLVQGPLVHAPEEPNGPAPHDPPPKGPPCPPPKPPWPLPAPGKPLGAPVIRVAKEPVGVAPPKNPTPPEMLAADVKLAQSLLEGPLGCADLYDESALLWEESSDEPKKPLPVGYADVSVVEAVVVADAPAARAATAAYWKVFIVIECCMLVVDWDIRD